MFYIKFNTKEDNLKELKLILILELYIFLSKAVFSINNLFIISLNSIYHFVLII